MTKRQKTALKNKAKTFLAILAILAAYAYVSNEDFKTLKLECEAGLRVCSVDANQ